MSVTTEERTKRVARGVILVQSCSIDPHYLLGQRLVDDPKLEYAGFWECFGGSEKPEDAGDMRKVAKREITEESGITVVRVGDVVHEFPRKYLPDPGDGTAVEPPYDWYMSVHFIIEAELPKRIILDPNEHMGYGWFTFKELMHLNHRIRRCSFEAIAAVQKQYVGFPKREL